MTANLTPQQIKNLTSKMWRLNNLYTIITKDKRKTILKLNYSQRQVLTQFKHPRKIILKSRQQGISTLYCAYYLDSCITKPNYSAGIQSYGKDEAEKLAQRAKLMWDGIPEVFKRALGIDLVKCNTQEMQFSNGSIFKIGNFRGDTLQGLHVSELGKIAIKFPEKARELKTGAFEAVGKGNRITIESTAEGKTGLFYELWKKASLKAGNRSELTPFDFEAIFLSWMQDPDCNIDTRIAIPVELSKYFNDLEQLLNIKLTDTQKWWYCAKYETLGEDMKREYPSYPEEAFEQSVEGTYYKNEYAKLRIGSELYDPNLRVHSAFDLGMNDDFSIGFFQIDIRDQVKIIGEYTNSGHGLEHYADVFKQLTKTRGWKHGITFVPHDIKQRELIAGKTRWQALKELGFNPVLVKKHKVQDGIEATRQFLKEVIIDESCETIRGAIQNYRKRYDQKLGVFLDAPLHDEFSHPADMLRYMAMGCKYRKPTDNLVTGGYRHYSSYSSSKSNSTNRFRTSGYDV
jgi:hypothetical protein